MRYVRTIIRLKTVSEQKVIAMNLNQLFIASFEPIIPIIPVINSKSEKLGMSVSEYIKPIEEIIDRRIPNKTGNPIFSSLDHRDNNLPAQISEIRGKPIKISNKSSPKNEYNGIIIVQITKII